MYICLNMLKAVIIDNVVKEQCTKKGRVVKLHRDNVYHTNLFIISTFYVLMSKRDN